MIPSVIGVQVSLAHFGNIGQGFQGGLTNTSITERRVLWVLLLTQAGETDVLSENKRLTGK